MNMKKTLITFLLLIAAITASAQNFSVFQGGAGSDIRPEGWLKEFLLRQKSGMTGHPEALSYPYNSCLWNGEIGRNTGLTVGIGGVMSKRHIILTGS